MSLVPRPFVPQLEVACTSVPSSVQIKVQMLDMGKNDQQPQQKGTDNTTRPNKSLVSSAARRSA